MDEQIAQVKALHARVQAENDQCKLVWYVDGSVARWHAGQFIRYPSVGDLALALQ